MHVSFFLCDAAQEMARDGLNATLFIVPILMGLALAFWAIFGGRPAPPEDQTPPPVNRSRAFPPKGRGAPPPDVHGSN